MTKQNIRIQSTASTSKSRRFKWAIIVLSFVIVGSVLFLKNWPSFGGTISGERLKRAQASSHYQNGKFANTLPHPALESGDVWGYLKEQFFGEQMRAPPSAIPILVIPPASIQVHPPPGLRAIWLGHSSVYIELDGLRLLVDPVFSNYASPFSGIGPKRFHAPPIAMTDLPRIDAVMISHDHYDHLDMRTIQYLSPREHTFLFPLGSDPILTNGEYQKAESLNWTGGNQRKYES